MKTILLKFSGPLQSWGTNSHFEIRNTDAHPSKSGVIGMIAAGLGYSRDDDENLARLNCLSYAVRIDQTGELLRDYHTAKKYKENGTFERTYVTTRYYLQDAVFIVALSCDDEKLIDDVKTAVMFPYYSLYLGRRSLPPTAELFLGVFDSDAVTILKEYPWQASPWYKKKNSARLRIYADESLLKSEKLEIRNDVALSFSQQRGRKFNPRAEFCLPIVLEKNQDHDAFDSVGEV